MVDFRDLEHGVVVGWTIQTLAADTGVFITQPHLEFTENG